MKLKELSIYNDKITIPSVEDVDKLQEKIDRLVMVSRLMGYEVRNYSWDIGSQYYTYRLSCGDDDEEKYAISFSGAKMYVSIVEVWRKGDHYDHMSIKNAGEILESLDKVLEYI